MAGIDSHLTYYFKHLEIINKYIFWNKSESNPSTCHHFKHAQNYRKIDIFEYSLDVTSVRIKVKVQC